MAKRFIVQKRELKEVNGKRPQLMGPYRTVYSDIRPPFDLSEKEKIEANLLRRYGEGRYQVKSVGKDEGEEKSTIKIFFTGDIERYRPHARIWTKEERVAALKFKHRTRKEKLFVAFGFVIVFLILVWAFFSTFAPELDSSLTTLAVIAMVITFLLAVFFIDMMFFEGE